MPKRSSNPPKGDVNQIAKSVVDRATSDDDSEHNPVGPELTEDGKNAAAVALGRLGGKKGGPARAKKLSSKRRKQIAKKAAEARWKNRES